MTKDLSLTVPFSPAMVFGPSMSRGDLMATHQPHVPVRTGQDSLSKAA